MENFDIIILTVIVSLLFLVFIIATYRELASAEIKNKRFGKESGPRAEMIRFVGSIFTDERIETKDKKELLNIIKKTLSDMEEDENS